jgi:hypothetical protein
LEHRTKEGVSTFGHSGDSLETRNCIAGWNFGVAVGLSKGFKDGVTYFHDVRIGEIANIVKSRVAFNGHHLFYTVRGM